LASVGLTPGNVSSVFKSALFTSTREVASVAELVVCDDECFANAVVVPAIATRPAVASANAYRRIEP